jgi:hypothetical protein
MYCYVWKNGLSMRAWNDPDNIQPGEIFFDHPPTIEELNASFPLYNSGITVLSREERLIELTSDYDAQRTELERYLNIAVNRLQDQELAAEIRQDLDNLDIEFIQKAEVIENGD